ncbi:MAG: phosphate ABC transporter substrate-binding protein [Actinobacteria bacterium]|nr:MAG: phosphate ABC transporter substrate-binding protein [Actinomycetota bacterium]
MNRTALSPSRILAAARALAAAVVLVSAGFVAVGCDISVGRAHELVITGSTTVLPIAEISGKEFEESHPGERVLVSGVGSSAGIEAVSKGTAAIGTSSRDLKDEEKGLGLFDTPVAYDAIVVIVNPANPVTGLTKDQVRAIFKGEITNWSEVGGPDESIGLVNRDEASGTREAFFKIVMKKERFADNAVILPGTGQVRAVVGDAEGAIGYISLGFVTPEVKALAIDGVAPSPATVESGEYPVQRTLHAFTKGTPTGLAKEYLEYLLSTEVQQGTVREAGFLPVRPKDAVR